MKYSLECLFKIHGKMHCYSITSKLNYKQSKTNVKIVRWKYVYEYQLINWIKNKFSIAFSKTLFKRFLFFFLNSIEQNRKPLNSFLFIYLTVINWWECQTKETWAIESSSYSACSTNRHENSRIWLYYCAIKHTHQYLQLI